MQCPKCQSRLVPDSVFCTECGARVESQCPSCGADNPGTARFCRRCGQAMAAPTGRALPSPAAYTPRHLAEKILRSKPFVEGERKRVTVLFADVKGSMEMQEDLDPEEWHAIMDRFLQILAAGVHRYEGTVNQYTGDGIMALFGAPIAHEDHAQRACYAALDLRDELRRYSQEIRIERGLNLSTRIGLNSGEVVVGKIGDDLRMDYTAQGHAVSLAARMEEIAEPGHIYLAGATAQLVEGFFQLRDLGSLRIKGVSGPQAVHELEGIGPLRTRLDVSRSRKLSEFVGRSSEMHVLESALAQALSGNGQVVGVVGEAGVGKSRVCLEFVERCRAKGLRVYEAHCPAHGRTVPFFAVHELLRSRFGVSAQDGDQTARDKIASQILRVDRALADELAVLFDFLGLVDPERPAPQMDPQSRQRRLYALVRRFMSATRQDPAVLHVDDLHWLDPESDEFLGQLVDGVGGTRTLLLATFRPEYQAPWHDRSYYQRLPLWPLTAGAMDELLGKLLGDDPSLLDLSRLIRERTHGNPFFVEELVQSLVESQSLVGPRGARRLTRAVQVLEVPATVQAVVAARIDRLSERDKLVLQTAAVCGKRFSGALLAEVAGLPEDALAGALAQLQAAEFIREEAVYPEAQYSFRHPLSCQVAYDSQLSGRRRRVHAAAAAAIEKQNPDKLDGVAALLAHHWEEAGDALHAAQWHRRAAERLVLGSQRQLMRHWRAVRELSKQLPQTREAVDLQIAGCIGVLVGGFNLGMSADEREEIFAEGRRVIERAGDPLAVGRLLTEYGWARIGVAEHREGSKLLEEAWALVRDGGDVVVRADNLAKVEVAQLLLGQPERVVDAHESMLRLAPELKGREDRWLDYAWAAGLAARGSALALLGRLDEAARFWSQGLEAAARLDSALPKAQVLAAITATTPVPILPSDRLFLDHAREAMREVSTVESQVVQGNAAMSLALLLARHAEFAAALELLGRSHRRAALGLSACQRADILLAASDAAQAASVAEETLSSGSLDETLPGKIRALVVLAQARVAADGARARDAAETALASAEALAADSGMRCHQPFIHDVRARLARALGDDKKEREEREAARRLFRAIGADELAEAPAGRS